LYRKSKHTFYAQELFFENGAIYEIMWKNIVEWGSPQIQYGALHAGYIRLPIHTLR
jgi:hypothetical protein